MKNYCWACTCAGSLNSSHVLRRLPGENAGRQALSLGGCKRPPPWRGPDPETRENSARLTSSLPKRAEEREHITAVNTARVSPPVFLLVCFCLFPLGWQHLEGPAPCRATSSPSVYPAVAASLLATAVSPREQPPRPGPGSRSRCPRSSPGPPAVPGPPRSRARSVRPAARTLRVPGETPPERPRVPAVAPCPCLLLPSPLLVFSLCALFYPPLVGTIPLLYQ